MTGPAEVTVTSVGYWVDKPEQLAQLLATSQALAIPDPSGRPVVPDQIAVFTLPALWAQYPGELRDALAFAAGEAGSSVASSRLAAGAVAAVENRLVFTVEEAAQLLGISRSFAYEAVQDGQIPSMRIGRRILVPKAALQRLLDSAGSTTTDTSLAPD